MRSQTARGKFDAWKVSGHGFAPERFDLPLVQAFVTIVCYLLELAARTDAHFGGPYLIVPRNCSVYLEGMKVRSCNLQMMTCGIT